MKQVAPEHPFFFSAVGGTDTGAVGGNDVAAVGGTDTGAVGGTDAAAPGGVTGAGVLGVNEGGADGGMLDPIPPCVGCGRFEAVGTAGGVGCGASGVVGRGCCSPGCIALPQKGQKRAPSASCLPHFVQNTSSTSPYPCAGL